MSAIRSLFDLGFYHLAPGQYEPGTLWTLPVKVKTVRDRAWELVSWLLLAIGIYFGQAIALDSQGIRFIPGHMAFMSFVASLVVAFAFFAVFMRWVNKQKPQRGISQIASPFAFGFFTVSTIGNVPHAIKLLFH
jgi:hypothetical protein